MNIVKILIKMVFFILFIFLVIKGQIIRNYSGLAIMLIGLAGLLIELYLYNRKYV